MLAELLPAKDLKLVELEINRVEEIEEITIIIMEEEDNKAKGQVEWEDKCIIKI